MDGTAMAKTKKVFLIIEKGTPYNSHEVFPISKTPFWIGRAGGERQPELCFESPYISRSHAEIRFQDGIYYMIDHSKGGIAVNGIALEKGRVYPLRSGERICLSGDEAVLIFGIGETPSETLTHDETNIYLDPEKREVWIDGRKLELTGNLYTLFHLLYQNRGKAVSALEIKLTVWPERQLDQGVPLVGDEEVAVLVKRLREKITQGEEWICNKRGYGYMLK